MTVVILDEQPYSPPPLEGGLLEGFAFCRWAHHHGEPAKRWFYLGIESPASTSPLGAVWVCEMHATEVRERRFSRLTQGINALVEIE